MKTHVWKVVEKRIDGTFISAASARNLRYPIGNVVEAPTSDGIFCWKTRTQARKFKRVVLLNPFRYRVFKTEVYVDDEIVTDFEFWKNNCGIGVVRYKKVKLLPIQG